MATTLISPCKCINNSTFLSASALNEVKFVKVNKFASGVSVSRPNRNRSRVRAIKEKTEELNSPSSSSSSAEEITEKFGLEAGLWKVGISSNETGQKVETFALAYAAHKAASPIRFPPTVALTPIVANWIGKKVNREN